MSQVEIERFLGRCITDADFRVRAATSLDSACYGEGFTLSNEEKSFLRQVDYSQFRSLAEALDDSIRRR
ncbi:MAG: hypothetical protein HXX11_19290 [Desulfuromonadales bacterium]|nr:hypothetical protein [Desulfuromonadales bacterium]